MRYITNIPFTRYLGLSVNEVYYIHQISCWKGQFKINHQICGHTIFKQHTFGTATCAKFSIRSGNSGTDKNNFWRVNILFCHGNTKKNIDWIHQMKDTNGELPWTKSRCLGHCSSSLGPPGLPMAVDTTDTTSDTTIGSFTAPWIHQNLLILVEVCQWIKDKIQETSIFHTKIYGFL